MISIDLVQFLLHQEREIQSKYLENMELVCNYIIR